MNLKTNLIDDEQGFSVILALIISVGLIVTLSVVLGLVILDTDSQDESPKTPQAYMDIVESEEGIVISSNYQRNVDEIRVLVNGEKPAGDVNTLTNRSDSLIVQTNEGDVITIIAENEDTEKEIQTITAIENTLPENKSTPRIINYE